MNNLFDSVKSLVMLERSLDLRALKHLQIVSNISNASNPGYEPFEAVLDGALQGLEGAKDASSLSRTDQRHLASAGATPEGVEYRPQVTKVEEEMARLTENHLMYNASVELLNRKLRILRLAITDRA